MPDASSYPRLIALLSQGTDRGHFTWKQTAEENTFRCLLGNGTVELSRVDTPGQLPRYLITLFDANNTVLEELWARSEEDAQSLGELYDRVRRSALNIDQAIEALMEEISERATAGGK
jgi:hypothetical protein